MDQYSNNGGYAIYNYRGNKTIKLNNDELPMHKILDFRKENYLGEFEKVVVAEFCNINDSSQKDEDKIKNYIEHVLRCYRLGCYIKSNGQQVDPRILDSLLLRVKTTN